MRLLTDHKLNGLNDALCVIAVDEPGVGGGNHQYAISFGDPSDCTGRSQQTLQIQFQNGPLREETPNGVSNESLIAVVIDRLRGFQSGEFRCKENACALTHFEEGLMWLQKRTRDRMARGVEGTLAK